MKQVADIVRQFRVERNWTLKRLAEFTGVQVWTLSKIENKRCNPNARTLYKLKKSIPQLEEDQPAA